MSAADMLSLEHFIGAGEKRRRHGERERTYTKIYARISAGPQGLGATVTACGTMSVTPR
jgi:hypothetical protein